ncbi:MAG: MMPL family transporter, partial [Solirubrobacterales bacterium]|nr:MMPL family transporter [Solirubrobacterales bacterium]
MARDGPDELTLTAKGLTLKSQNLAARAGRWSAEHWKTATAIWLVFVLAAVTVGQLVGTHKLSDSEQSTGESAKAQQILSSAGFSTPAAESVLVRSTALTVDDPAFRSGVASVTGTLRAMPQVKNLRTGLRGQVSRDRHAQLVEFDMRGKMDTADKRVQPLLDAVAGVQRAHPGFTVAEFGMASAMHELNNTITKDFQKAEQLSVPITFVILLFAFGALVAAGVPVLLAFSAVLGSLGLSQLASHVFHASDATQSVMLLMGMAVGVDYSLFYLKREREERAAGHRGHEGLFRAAATSGQAVLVSGCTALIAMAGMLLAGSSIFVSIGIGAMIVVFTALVGSLTVLPAMLGKLGDRVERGLRQVLAASFLRVVRPLRTQPRWLVWLREQPTVLRRLKGERQESRV